MAYNQHSDPFEDQVHVPTLPYTSSSPRPSSPRHGAQQTLYPAGEGAAESQLSLAETKYDALGEDDEEVAPLRQAYPPSHGVPLPPGLPEEYGFPSAGYTPSFSDAGRPYSSVSSGLYRSQTTTEAWHRRQRIDRNRAKTVKVKLERGHFIADYAVPSLSTILSVLADALNLIAQHPSGMQTSRPDTRENRKSLHTPFPLEVLRLTTLAGSRTCDTRPSLATRTTSPARTDGRCERRTMAARPTCS